MKAAVYTRVSTEEQVASGSIATQRTFAERHCELNQVTVYGWYADDGISGTIKLQDRPEGARLLDDARQGKFDTLLIYKLDRLGRDSRLILNAVGDLEALGVQTKSLTEPFDTSVPSGRFLLTILSGVAGLERDTIIERSMEGSNRLAREGAWLGGIAPYGYRVEGKGRDARLVTSDEPVSGLELSEVDIIRLIYRFTVEERKSCTQIASYLNMLGVSTAYARDGREPLRGKRKQATAGIWRAGRVRSLIVATVYKGEYTYGKRSKRQREVITRQVPALVTVEVWEQAQQVLKSNMLFSKRNAKRQYLLRGLIKCGQCGLTYIGTAYPEYHKGQRVYYVCNGKHSARNIYGSTDKRCRSKAISGDIENKVWDDIESFLRNPGDVLAQLGSQLQERAGEVKHLNAEITKMQRVLGSKDDERNAVVALFRKGTIDAATLDRQLADVAREEDFLQKELAVSLARTRDAEAQRAHLSSTEALLGELNNRLDEPITWERKRQLVETLVHDIRVDTVEEGSKKTATAKVTYHFEPSAPRSSITIGNDALADTMATR